ncbi:hypothetical protein MHU86_14936 [Fragilaria crotonensis]|nr:hypothetical protein MHU86_14936 [Fragilaria crotonensis]
MLLNIREKGVTDSADTALFNDIYSFEHSDDFSNVAGRAVKSAVPCSRPRTSIELLQVIEHRDVEERGLFKRKAVLKNPGSHGTLISYVNDIQKDELECIVNNAGVQYIQASDVTQSAAITSRLYASCPLTNDDLANVGLEMNSDDRWRPSFGKGGIKKKSVSMIGLTKFLNKYGVTWRRDSIDVKAVVTAIYSVSAELTLTGDAKLATIGGEHLVPATTGPLGEGWKYTVMDAGKVVLSETNPREWIIAIEYRQLEDVKREGGGGNLIRIEAT